MSRYPRWPIALLALTQPPLSAQTSASSPRSALADRYEDCSQAEKDAAAISGEIVVCRKRSDNDRFRTLPGDKAEARYAEETQRKGDPGAPDFAKSCKKNPGGACMKLGSVPPPAYMIDFSKLPDAPPGSDADRIAKGERPQ